MTTAAQKPTDRLEIVYRDTDHMAENALQRLMSIYLLLLIKRFLREVTEGSLAKSKGYKALRAQGPLFSCADQFWYWSKGETHKCLAPDVYVLPKTDPTVAPSCWRLWELACAPLFALEIVSSDVDKDYDETPASYAQTGVSELVIFDPEAPRMAAVSGAKNERVRVRWQIWRRGPKGQWKREVESNDDRVQSQSLCCWLRLVGKGDARLLRLGMGPNGDDLFLSSDEREIFERSEKERERSEKEHERSEKERERNEKEAERQARERAEERIRTLEEELAKATLKRRS